MSGYRAVLRNAAFRRLWVGQAISGLGDALYRLALILLITEQTKSPYAIALASLAQLLPVILFGPFVGVLVDRWEKKRVMLAADVVRGCLVLVPLVSKDLAVLYAVSFLLGFAGLFFAPARSTIVPEIVGRQDYMTAVGLSQITFQIIALVGPALGGMLVGLWGFDLAFGLDAASFIVSAAATLSVTMPVVRAAGAPGVRAFMDSFRQGMAFLWGAPVLRFLVQVLALSVVGFGFFGILLVDYTRNVLAVSRQTFGFLEATIAGAMILAAFVVGQRGTRLRRLPLILTGLFLIALPGVIFFLRPPVEVVFLWAALLGLGEGTLHLPLNAVFVEMTPLEKRGRVFAATNSIANAGNLLGFMGAGPLASAIGSWNGMGLASAATLLMLGLMVLSPRYAQASRQERAARVEA